MNTLQTLQSNRDLYLAVTNLCALQKESTRSLETYLLAMMGLLAPLAAKEHITLDDFYRLLEGSFVAEPSNFVPEWAAQYRASFDQREGFVGVEALLKRQILDLHEMEESGDLADEERFFGLDAPRGARWYNFMPTGYLECGIAGSFGGWEPEDDTGRSFVPGPVAVLVDGTITGVAPEDIERPHVPIPTIDWDDLYEFLVDGQCYE